MPGNLFFAAFLFIFVFLPTGAMAEDETADPLRPQLVVEQLDRKTFDLSAQRGKVVVVNFWATWCGPCREEMPALDAVYRRYRKDGLAMIGVSADRPGNRDDVVKIMRRFNYPAAMLDTAKNNGFGWPSALPVTYIIDREGAIRARMAPNEIVLTEDSLTKALEPLLVKQAVVDKRP